MKKSAVKLFFLLILLTAVAVPAPILAQSTGSVKGIFDAIRNFRQKSAPVTLDEVSRETQELNQAKMELDQTIVEKQAMMMEKTREQMMMNMDKWSAYLNNIKQKYSIPSPLEVTVSSEYLDAELSYIDVKKTELTGITTKEGMMTFVTDMKVHRDQVLANLGQVRTQAYGQVVTNLESRVAKTEELLTRFDNKLSDLSARGFETGEAGEVLAEVRTGLDETAGRLEETRGMLTDKTELTREEGQQVREGITDVRQGLREVAGRLGEVVRTATRSGRAGGTTGRGRGTTSPVGRVTGRPVITIPIGRNTIPTTDPFEPVMER